MKSLTTTASLLLWLAISQASPAQLTWKFADGQSLRTTVDIDVKQTLNLGGNPVKTSSESTRVLRSKAGTRAADGSIEVTTEVESVKSKIGLPGDMTIEFDSDEESPDAEGPLKMLTDLLKLTSRIKFVATYGADNRVSSVEVSSDIMKDLDDASRVAVESQLDPEAIKSGLNEELSKIPNRKLSPGDKWEETSRVRLEGKQTLIFKTQYNYEGIVREQGVSLDKISTKAVNVKYEMQPTSISPLKLKSSELEVKDGDGVILFDRQLGQIAKSSSDLHITGSMMFDLNGTDLPADLDLRMKTEQVTR